ncbi:MAG: hypothetical protein ACREQZ_04210 [Woeseiaceae bacterium]
MKTKKKTTKPKKDPNQYPPGWNAAKVKKLIAYYENQTEDEAVEEDEAAYAHEHSSMIEVPNRLVPVVRELVARAR